MVEFCDKCEGMMLPFKKMDDNFLKCNSCGNIVPLKNDLRDSYTFTKTIEHPRGTEFKSLIKMENWMQKKNES
jgi:DNA-directed RNA polymerase subunit M/transcription elongation factor TFIIS